MFRDESRRRNHLYCQYALEKNPSDLIKKVSSLLENPITVNDFERQDVLIDDYLELSPNGPMIEDLFFLMKVIDCYSQKIMVGDAGPSNALLDKLITICHFPPLLKKASDILTYAADLKEYFSLLGFQLLRLETESTQLLLVDSLRNLLNTPSKRDIWSASLEQRQNAFESSNLPAIFGQLLRTSSDTIYSHILKILLKCRRTKEFLRPLIKQDALNALFVRLEPRWRDRYPNKEPEVNVTEKVIIEHFEQFSDLVWILLKFFEQNIVNLDSIANIEMFSLWNLRYAFHVFLMPDQSRVCRNDVLAIIIKLMQLFPCMDFVMSGLAADILQQSLQMKIWPNNSPTQLNDIDFIYVKLFLVIVTLYGHFDGGQLLEEEKVMPQLLNMIKHHNNNSWTKWSAEHLSLIIDMSWYALRQIIQYVEDEFVENSGFLIILNCFKMQSSSPNNFFVLDKCLATFAHLLKRDNMKSYLYSLIYNDGLWVILDLCESYLSLNSLPVQTQFCIKRSFYILSKLCPGQDPPFEIVNLTMKYLDRFLKPSPEEPVYDNGIIVYILDFIWEVIIHNEQLFKAAIKENVIGKLLDIAQIYPLHVKIISLGILVDICEDDIAVPYIITWRGQKGITIVPLLMEIFRCENKLLRVAMGPTGKILDTLNPIMGEDQKMQTYSDKPTACSPVIYDMFLSCRPKIYALLRLLFDRHKEKVEIANEHYQTLNENLKVEDQVTLLLADNYLTMKLHEAWNELEIEFQACAFTPAPTDMKILKCLVERSKKWGKLLMKLQQGVLREDTTLGILEERELYNTLVEARSQEALQALYELKYLSRSTEKMFRVSAKFTQHNSIDLNLKKLATNISDLHRTYQYLPCVTPVFNQDVSVQSNIIEVEKKIEPRPVSPEGSDLGLQSSDDNCSEDTRNCILFNVE